MMDTASEQTPGGGGLDRYLALMTAYNDEVIPRLIPATTLRHYISCETALNIGYDWEETGDWHRRTALFVPASINRNAELFCAGEGTRLDTTPSLGSTGVRNMRRWLARLYKMEIDSPVWVANHFRAIADLVMSDQSRITRLVTDRPDAQWGTPGYRLRRAATVGEINRWLNTEEEIAELVTDYLKPMRHQMEGLCRRLYDDWLPTLVWA